jgi:hypothetical protein
MRINPFIYGILVLGVFLGTILGFQSAGVWSISGKVSGSGEQVAPSSSDVNTIKGWMTLEQVATTFNAPVGEILTVFSLSADTPADTPIKDLESDTFSVTSLRTRLENRAKP